MSKGGMGSVSGWIDLAKWTCFGLYFVLEDLTIVCTQPRTMAETDHETATCNGRLLGAVGRTGDVRGEPVLVLCLVFLHSWVTLCPRIFAHWTDISGQGWKAEEQ